MNVLDKDENFLYRLKYPISLGWYHVAVEKGAKFRSTLEIAPSRTVQGIQQLSFPLNQQLQI